MSSASDSTSAGPSHIFTESHLSYPAEGSGITAPTPTPQPRQVLKDRLYVGNLHPTVDEHTLIKVFSKFGKISKLDYLFHKTGLLKGKPRGYVFIEYANAEDAAKAIASAHDKVLRGRKLLVTYATQAPLNDVGGSGQKYRKGALEANRPTTLSLLKAGVTTSRNDTNDKIARLEAKLRQMESQDASTSTSSTPTSSLPMKPSRAVTVPAFAAAAQLQSRVPHSKVTNPSSAVTNTSGAKTTAGSFINIRRGIPPSVPPRPRVVAPSSTTGRPNSAHSSSKLTESRLP